MIKFFRKIRKKLLVENQVTKYFLYAIGEIVLVVIGILIALQINNNNELNKTRVKEVQYLSNISKDLELNIIELDKYIAKRESQIESAISILKHFEGEPITDYIEFNNNTINIYTWRKFFQNNNTFQELVNSGNLSLISNQEIKNVLLELEKVYKVTKDEEEHFRFDSEELLYKPYFNKIDCYPLVENFKYQVSKGQIGKNIPISRTEIDKMLNDLTQKNGFVMAEFEFSALKSQFQSMKKICENAIELIKDEIKNEG